ncbi:MAG: UDP-glucose--hexose-1-phosphate uridylyltransferase [Lachnospiraceae bacterium]|nr:UDP-glucose--hexose-1-phosphate uridylyltransferase [Lachnospiraceae bacterium]
MNVFDAVKALVAYGLEHSLIEKEDVIYAANRILGVLGLEPDGDFSCEGGESAPLEDILKVLLDDAAHRGLIGDGITERDLLDTRLMGELTPRPSEVIKTFKEKYEVSPKEATDYFYRLCRDNDYIRTYRVKKDRKWKAPSKYGDLDITINLSKPEKDPKAIAAALNKKQNAYPKCLLCPENEGYFGRLDHPARQNIRLIPLKLNGEDWYMQYSPYVYYNEHCIVLSKHHVPMKIDVNTFKRLTEFVTYLPHYVIGSNADLPIVGGSILTHEHFQGGNYEFPMAKAREREKLGFKGYDDIEASVLDWPMSVIRLKSADADRLVELSDKILSCWRGYSDEENEILAETDAPHNTITPIVRRRGELFEIDLVLRNNRTTDEHPLGIFHPHAELHHIKKENIGLIEVMGVAILPARLLKEMDLLKDALVNGTDADAVPEIKAHADWAKEITAKHGNINKDNVDDIIEQEIGLVFSKVLEHCGVFKDDESGRAGIKRFAESVN